MLHTHPNDPETPELPRAQTVYVSLSFRVYCEPGTERLWIEVCPWGVARGNDGDAGPPEYIGADLSSLTGAACIDGETRTLAVEDGCLVVELED